MKKKVLFNEIAGKTVEGFAFSFSNKELLIAFKDNTFIAVGYTEGFHSGDDGIADIELDLSDFYEEDLIGTLVDSPEELANIREGIRDRDKTLKAIAERATYERLKIKYENSKVVK